MYYSKITNIFISIFQTSSMYFLHSSFEEKIGKKSTRNHSIANSSLFLTLHIFTLKFHSNFSPKIMFFSLFRVQKIDFFFCKRGIMQLFSADAIVFSYYEISGPDICSLICAKNCLLGM